jgi:hypothetical protein
LLEAYIHTWIERDGQIFKSLDTEGEGEREERGRERKRVSEREAGRGERSERREK